MELITFITFKRITDVYVYMKKAVSDFKSFQILKLLQILCNPFLKTNQSTKKKKETPVKLLINFI